MTRNWLTIGQLAEAGNVNLQTIRYYQRRGLMAQPVKPASGYRLYPSSEVKRLRFIKRAQALGFTLSEISQLLALQDGHCRDVQKLAAAKRADIKRKIRDLTEMNKALTALLAACRTSAPPSPCPLIDSLRTPE